MKRFLGILLIFAVAAAAAWLDSNYRLVTERYTLASPVLPKEAEGLRVVHLTDLHGEWPGALIGAVRDAEPDIIAVTGDIVDGDAASFEAERDYITMAIRELCAVAPVYYVPGNHEWASPGAHELIEAVAEAGGTVLRNDYVLFRGIVIAGCDDPNGPYDQPSPGDVVGRIRNAEGGKFILMLYHRHDRLIQWSKLGVDCVLCGHAHGGMVRLPFTDGLYAPGHVFLPTCTNGIYRERATAEVVSRGIGGPKYRLFNNPEVLVLELTGK